MSTVDPQEIQQIEGRLKEVWHKHIRVIISDDPDVAEVKERLERILSRLAQWSRELPSKQEIRSAARELGMAHRQLSILGFTNIARVLARIEESLAELGIDAVTAPPPQTPRRFEAEIAATRIDHDPEERARLDSLEAPIHRPPLGVSLFFVFAGSLIGWAIGLALVGVDAPLAGGRLVFLASGIILGAGVALIHRSHPHTNGVALGRLLVLSVWTLGAVGSIVLMTSLPSPPAREIAEQSSQAQPTATPTPPPTPTRPAFDSYAVNLEDLSARVTLEVSRTEEALERGDLETAINHFAKAVSTDRYHRKVSECAEKLVDAMLDEADSSADLGNWERATELVDDAEELAEHFRLDTARVKHTRARHNSMARFVDVPPSDTTTLKQSIGQRVKITLPPSDLVRGTIMEIDSQKLTLDVLSGVGGGQVHFTRDYPLSTISNIRIYGEGLIDPPREMATPTPSPPPRRHRLPYRSRRSRRPGQRHGG